MQLENLLSNGKNQVAGKSVAHMEDEDEIYLKKKDYREKIIYRWSICGQLQRKKIALYRRGFQWWLTVGAIVGVMLGLAAGAVLLLTYGW